MILLANTSDGSMKKSIRTDSLSALTKKKRSRLAEIIIANEDMKMKIIITVKWLSHKSVVRRALVKLQLLGVW